MGNYTGPHKKWKMLQRGSGKRCRGEVENVAEGSMKKPSSVLDSIIPLCAIVFFHVHE